MENHRVEDSNEFSSRNVSKGQKILRIVLIVLLIFLFILNGIFYGLDLGGGKDIGLYINSTRDIFNYYYVEITPADWGWGLLNTIYVFQGLLVVFCFVNIFRKLPSGTRLYYDPNFITPTFMGIYALSFVFNAAWMFLFDRSITNPVLLSVACACLWITVGLLTGALVVAYIDLDREIPNLIKYRKCSDIGRIRTFAHNGISLFATWCAVGSLVNTAMALAHVQKMAQEDACTIALAILAVEIVVYVSADTFLLDRWTRFTLAPHFVLVWALSTIVARNYVPGKRNSIFTAVLLAVAIAALIEKIILMIMRSIKDPKCNCSSNKVCNNKIPEMGSRKEILG